MKRGCLRKELDSAGIKVSEFLRESGMDRVTVARIDDLNFNVRPSTVSRAFIVLDRMKERKGIPAAESRSQSA